MKKQTPKEIENEVFKMIFGLERGDLVEIDLPTWHQIGTIEEIILFDCKRKPLFSIKTKKQGLIGYFGLEDLKLIEKNFKQNKEEKK